MDELNGMARLNSIREARWISYFLLVMSASEERVVSKGDTFPQNNKLN